MNNQCMEFVILLILYEALWQAESKSWLSAGAFFKRWIILEIEALITFAPMNITTFQKFACSVSSHFTYTVMLQNIFFHAAFIYNLPWAFASPCSRFDVCIFKGLAYEDISYLKSSGGMQSLPVCVMTSVSFFVDLWISLLCLI